MSYYPNSEVRLLSGIPLNPSYENTILFNTKAEQQAYFESKIHMGLEYNDFTTITPNRKLKVYKNIEEVKNCNYIMYRNTQFSNKWYYAFISSINFMNNNTTEIDYEIDVFQTWLFDFELKPSFVEREHVSNDAIGANTSMENVDLGELVYNTGKKEVIPFNWFVYTSEKLELAGITYIEPDFDTLSACYTISLGRDYGLLRTVVDSFAGDGKLSSIIAVFAVPEKTFAVYDMPPVTAGLGGYVPKNNKLYTYPYNFVEVLSCGQSATYNYEQFYNTPTLRFECVQLPSGNGILFAESYEVAGNQYNGITTGTFPQCAINGNAFQNYIAQNALSLNMSGVGVGANIVGSISNMVQGNYLGGIAGLYGSAVNGVGLLNTTYQRYLTPRNISGTAGASNTVYMKAKGVTFTISNKSIKAEFARRIDDYFSMYGYKVNQMKVPALKTRQSWNFVKTSGVNIIGDFSQNDLAKMRNAFNTGITFWHTTDVGNYNLNNSIV